MSVGECYKPFYKLVNVRQDVIVGYISRKRIGRFLHWVFEPESDTFFTNGCLKDISKFITGLYSKSKI